MNKRKVVKMQRDDGYQENKHRTIKQNVDPSFVEVSDHALNSVKLVLFAIAKVEDYTDSINEKKAANRK